MRILVTLFGLLLSAGDSPSALAQEDECTFDATLDAHLEAIQARDLDALIATLTSGEALTLIFPDGEKLDTKQEYIDFHESWFADENWTMQMKILRSIETGELGHALVRYRYSTTTEDGKPRVSENYVAFTFAKEGGCWGLVFDQNTSIESP